VKRAAQMPRLASAKRVVLKVGTGLLTDENGIREEMLKKLAEETLFLRARGIEVILVTSGAVGMARSILRGHSMADNLARKQALAAIGQGRLIAQYARVFEPAGILTAQLLITARDLRDRRAYLNIGNTIEELLKMGVLPVINENDTVSTDELRFGDNDLLSAAVSSLAGADILIILTSAPGFLVDGQRVGFLYEVTAELMKHALGPAGPGSGGMRTKMRAGQLCLISGQMLAILPGEESSPVQALFGGADIGTLVAGESRRRISARKKWLLYARSEGEIVVDDGAAAALREKGSSLLPAGIRELRGTFLSGDPVDVVTGSGEVIGRGIANYSKRDLENRTAVRRLHGPPEVIHRDNLIVE
jgi:glutamate 5-kinase